MKIDINLSSIFQGVIIAGLASAFAWCWNINAKIAVLEERSDVKTRVENLEQILNPLLVEYRVEKKLREAGLSSAADIVSGISPGSDPWNSPPVFPTPFFSTPVPLAPSAPSNTLPERNFKDPRYDGLYEEAEKWAQEQFTIPGGK